jgi:hypothetical protein
VMSSRVTTSNKTLLPSSLSFFSSPSPVNRTRRLNPNLRRAGESGYRRHDAALLSPSVFVSPLLSTGADPIVSSVRRGAARRRQLRDGEGGIRVVAARLRSMRQARVPPVRFLPPRPASLFRSRDKI